MNFPAVFYLEIRYSKNCRKTAGFVGKMRSASATYALKTRFFLSKQSYPTKI